MKAFGIVVRNNTISEKGFKFLQKSSSKVFNVFEIERYNAVTPDIVGQKMIEHNLTWNYPWDRKEFDIASGLLKSPYPTKNKSARIACALSHYELWDQCSKGDEPFLILEHDALFIEQLHTKIAGPSVYNIIGINHPRGATRRSKNFHDSINPIGPDIQPVPTVDEDRVPQGIAGNSAYIIKPDAAKHLKLLVSQFGLWPNDAIMCKQLMPKLGVTKTFYTEVQGLPSTTSL